MHTPPHKARQETDSVHSTIPQELPEQILPPELMLQVCIASQTCSMSSGGRICSGNSCGIVECTESVSCLALCGGVCIYPDILPPPGSPRVGLCDNSAPRSVNTCDIGVGCNRDSDCLFCGG